MIKYLDQLEKDDLKGKKVLLRLDLNVSVADGKVVDQFRLEKIIPTIDFLREHDAQTIIISHAENKEGQNESLLTVWNYLKGYFPVEFCPTYFTPEAIDKLLKMQDKDVLLFENVRNNMGEKENNPEFAKKLAQMADIYVNDAFGVSHRQHASIVGVPQFLPHYGGLLMRQEIEHLSRIFNPQHPFVFILGGAKFDTKLPLIKKYLEKADHVFVGGALANDIFKARGYEVGTSLVSKAAFDTSILENPKLVLPIDVTVAKDDKSVSFKKPNEVKSDECIVDAGPETIEQLKNLCNDAHSTSSGQAKTVVWNGPLGNYEKGFGDKTESLAEIIVEMTKNDIETIIGGGDTLASIHKLGLNDSFTFISTGGGAMLDFLVNETLPGLRALEK
ncbi:MAG: Bifunctional PGK/TIM [Parcubacteria group bacterium GW2011_GWF2_39_8b]|uniref:Phosphoglycerate kinase n=2 Tax=Candidatus Zambryskiibacteriota TaxID=1817925 RepID=A0A1G2T773_9BACT|nr:MAG: Bifunctional PGK/TIM [Parcubacteria group bacterium GW2011_GWF2_39_8b]KKR46174.1 MAG: Bifunctional PGK/TIM [Parcubacteria group bacterium GW2011_GWA2_40_14]OHA93100.1 MAG: phosphoglycerate kinase [Candidatus Zambryskibacteria bacterium RIFCSPHIGHO2_02_38_10.5]OHA95680.1 MAG: phosphoglycerate kinase [Candidatus Zambryskibacteria bacterium RIFCSPHIGHO2_02_FULL_39_82]OHA98596.1 MAG: phosphoglycerate kinase [Candidatus Zambryskibacteria bacterium RIFCSPHIGHO2_12_FULL_38_37]OHB09212.1 MAG: 